MPVTYEHNVDEGWEGVFFNLEPNDPEYTIGFLRTLTPTEEDRSNGHDRVCVTYFGASAYGCIKGWEQVDKSAIRLHLSHEGAQLLQLEPVTEFECDDVDDNTEGFERVREMLHSTGELIA